MTDWSRVKLDWSNLFYYLGTQKQHIFFIGQIQSSQNGDKLISDHFPYGERVF